MFDYEKLGAFYLGKEFDLASGDVTSDVVMYDAKDLTTHAVIVGMTGSGKTGLGITLLEEAAIDGIPALIIDPKGDMGNLMLSFPQLRPSDFEPWIEREEALRQGLSIAESAEKKAELWRDGLAAWDQSPDRIAKYQGAAEVAIYTPGSDAGLPVTVLRSLAAPGPAVLESADLLREQVSTAASGLLTLLGVDADPLRSREHILLSNILERAWSAGRSLDLSQLIREIQSPGMTQIGVMDLETIFPASDRMQFAMTVNNILASPAFASWTSGTPLNVCNLLYTDSGKPRLAVLSIAHLSDRERMFFVTTLLNEVISWMRAQPGTSSLRAILYMDEVFGYMPPTANPPTKAPLLTLLKQARAYGLGVVLATQNPVDLDYKALSNAGTWFLGRLQTERDKLRVLDGLEGASVAAGARFDRQKTEQILSGLRNRVFLLHNVHEDHPVVFQSRWALSYLRGPLTREQIQRLMASRKEAVASGRGSLVASSASGDAPNAETALPLNRQAPVLAPEIHQRHLPVAVRNVRAEEIEYHPAILAKGQTHFVDAKSKTDVWRKCGMLVRVEDGLTKDPWLDGERVDLSALQNGKPLEGASYAELPSECAKASSYRSWASSFKNYLYRTWPLTLSSCPELKMYSNPEEREGEFRARLAHQAREQRDLKMEQLKKKHESKVATLQERRRKAEQRVDREKEQAQSAMMSAAMTFGSSVLGALFGRKKLSATNVGRATTSMRAAGRARDQRGDISRAQDNVEAIQEEIDALNAEVEKQLKEIQDAHVPDGLAIESYDINPRKSDLSVDDVLLVWLPYARSLDGMRPAFDDALLQRNE